MKKSQSFQHHQNRHPNHIGLSELREQDTRFVVSLGIASQVLDLVDDGHPNRPEGIPRETASFLMFRLLHEGQVMIGLDIYSLPSCISGSSSMHTELQGTRYFLPMQGDSPIPEYIDTVSLEAIREEVGKRKLQPDPPLFTYKEFGH
ncbi:MAG TPA: hypothetical protein VMR95_00165 [Candidatus Binatia bacterium]|jgi:hypothetical protein|nr:hypothetical protein [Candidatus Binatia bacterium]